MITIVSGTNRKDSITLSICLFYQQLLRELKTESRIINLNELTADFASVSLYEFPGQNEAFNHFRQLMKESQKYVFVVPEYNGSFPGVLKAFIDGMEYPHTFKNKKCALVGLSSGDQGGILALSHLTDIFNYCGANVLALKPRLGRIEANLNQEMQLTNALYTSLLAEQAEQLIRF